MVDILARPRRPRIEQPSFITVRFKDGLPINSLPGWEDIPLNSKLPMLRCPDRKVIFTKDKIGERYTRYHYDEQPLDHEFKIDVYHARMDYNPLQDPHLRAFYNTERNLKRLIENGEITEDQDVICTLRDFNKFRDELYRTKSHYINKATSAENYDLRDRLLIQNAEQIAQDDYMHVTTRKQSAHEVQDRREALERDRDAYFRRKLEETNAKIRRVETLREMRKVLTEHKRELQRMNQAKHEETRQDLDRKRMIMVKKVFQTKCFRSEKTLKMLKINRVTNAHTAIVDSWNYRMMDRALQEQKMTRLMAIALESRRQFIENHMHRHQRQWQQHQVEIKKRSRRMNKYITRLMKKLRLRKDREQERLLRKTAEEAEEEEEMLAAGECEEQSSDFIYAGEPDETLEDKRQSFCLMFQESFDKLLDEELCEALEAALDMESGEVKAPFNPDDPIYKAARFIMQHIIAKFDKDLNYDKVTFKKTATRMSKFFDEVSQFVIFRATQIISAIRDSSLSSQSLTNFRSITSMPGRRSSTLQKFVSFSRFAATIGTSSYIIHPMTEVRPVSARTPTPAGSLASIVVDSHESLVHKTQTQHLCRNELIFVEHFVTKFKREVIVGLGKRVFAAIECYFRNEKMEIRQDFLNVDKRFLVGQATQGILGYAVNPCNFNTALKICISSLSANIITKLQKELLKPTQPEPEPEPLCNVMDRMKHKQRLRICHYCNQ